MLRTSLTHPTPEELIGFLEAELRERAAMVQVAGEFEVFYSGRAASVAEAGDYLLIVKPDGSVQVHGSRGVKPVNWQPQTDDIRVACEDGYAVLMAERFVPSETLRIGFLAPSAAQSFELREGAGFVLMGSEAEMQAALASDPGVIEPGLSLVDLEIPTDVGGIDLLARDAEGALVVVELKRAKANHEAVYQLARYVQSVKTVWDGAVRGILAAPAVTAPALNRLGALGLEFREVTALPDPDLDHVVQEALF